MPVHSATLRRQDHSVHDLVLLPEPLADLLSLPQCPLGLLLIEHWR